MKTWLPSTSLRTTRLLAAFAGGVLLLGSALSSTAAQVTFDFLAEIRNASTFPGVARFDIVAGSYTFESTTPDVNNAASVGSYPLVLRSMTIVAGGHTYTLTGSNGAGNHITVINDFLTVSGETTDRYVVSADLTGGTTMDIDADDRLGTAFPSDELPLNPPNLPGFVNNNFFLRQGALLARGRIISITKVATDTTAPVLSLPANLVVEATSPAGATATYSASANDDTDGSVAVTLNPASGSTFPLGTTTVNASASDAAGNTAAGTFTVTVRDTTPPVLSLPASGTVEATGPGGAAVTFSGSASDIVSGAVAVNFSPASGSTFPLGTTTVNASATDAAGNTASGSFTVTVRDTTAPVITSLAASPAVLWPPNHKMVSVSVSGTATEAVSEVTGRILSVTSSEPDNGLGDGDTAGDIVVTGPGTVSLRAERAAQGNGRTYTILFEVRDAAGNASTRTTTVSVPKSQGK